MPGIGDKLMTASEIKEVTDTKLDKDFSSLDTSGGFSLSDTIPVNISGTTYKITGQTLSNAIGGGGGTQQASLTNYVKNCGTISVLPVTLTDSNITSDMIVIEYTIGDENALGSDWTVTTADGSLTISGTLNKSTTLQLVLSVGYSTTPSILTNLASDSADNILKASPRPGVTGVLPLTHGGVGSSTASGARTNLSVYSKAETDSAIAQSTANNTWTSTTIGTFAHGSLIATKNAFLKLVIMRWAGNSTRPTETVTTVTLPANLIPAQGQIAPIRNGESIEARLDGTARITFTSALSAWSGGQVVYNAST